MASSPYQAALQLAGTMDREEVLRLIHELTKAVRDDSSQPAKHSILELRGLGKEIWEGADVAEYLKIERASWDG